MDDDDFKGVLELLKAQGLTFGMCTQVFGESINNSEYVATAIANYNKDGEVEVDDTSVVSHSVEGAYVMAWVWVSDNDLPKEKE
jgi:hypothetical protein